MLIYPILKKRIHGERAMKKILATLAVMLILGLPAFAADNLDSMYKKAMQQYNLRHYAKAAEIFKEYVKQRPEAAAYYRIGYSLYKLHKTVEADQYFEYAYMISPDFSPGPFVSSMHPQAEPPAPKPAAKPAALAPAPAAQIKPATAAPAAPAAQAPSSAAPATSAAQARPATAVTAPIAAAVQPSPATPAAANAPATPPLAPRAAAPAAPVAQAPPAAQAPSAAQAPKPAAPAPATVPAQSFVAKNKLNLIIGAIVAIYLIISLLLYRHARNARVKASWIAFIPLIQFAVIVLAIKAHGAPPLSGPGPSDLPGFGDFKFTDEDFSASSTKPTQPAAPPKEPESKGPETKAGEFSFPSAPAAPEAGAGESEGKTPAEETTFEIPEEEVDAPGSEKFKMNLSEGSELKSDDFKFDTSEDFSGTEKPKADEEEKK